MATNVIQPGQERALFSKHSFSAVERYVLRRAHPRAVFIDVVGVIWFTYYFWHQDWLSAIGAVVIFRVMALLAVSNTHIQSLAETTLGKMALLHLHPMNLLTQTIGLIALLMGLWRHSVEYSLVGLSIILLGHLAGWAEVDVRWRDKDESDAVGVSRGY